MKQMLFNTKDMREGTEVNSLAHIIKELHRKARKEFKEMGAGNIAFGRCYHRPITELSIILCFLLLTSCYSYKPLVASNENFDNAVAEKISRIKVGKIYRFNLKGDRRVTIKVRKIENNEVHGEIFNPPQPFWFSISEIEDVTLRKFKPGRTFFVVVLPVFITYLIISPPTVKSGGWFGPPTIVW